MTAIVTDDKHGHDIVLRGMVHEVAFTPVWDCTNGQGDNQLLLVIEHAPNGALIYQEDIDALYEFLSRYVSKP